MRKQLSADRPRRLTILRAPEPSQQNIVFCRTRGDENSCQSSEAIQCLGRTKVYQNIDVPTMVMRGGCGLTVWKTCQSSWDGLPHNAIGSLQSGFGPVSLVCHHKNNALLAAGQMVSTKRDLGISSVCNYGMSGAFLGWERVFAIANSTWASLQLQCFIYTQMKVRYSFSSRPKENYRAG